MVFDAIAVATQSDLKQKRALVNRILASSVLSRSVRLKTLFQYLCARSLDEGALDIHELEVGHKVFDRPAQYDTIADNIVRVHASMLRKRLNEFFETEGQHEKFTVEIPRGNYAPLFIDRPAGHRPRTEIHPPSAEILLHTFSSGLEPAYLTEFAQVPASSRRSSTLWALRIVSLLAVLFCGLSIFLFLSLRQTRRTELPAIVTNPPTVRQFWSGVFPEQGPTEIVFDDASLDFYRETTNQPVTLDKYYDRSYLTSIEKSAAASKLDPQIVHSLMLSRQSSFADAALTWKMAQIAGELHGTANVQFARDLTFRQVKAGNLILLGNPQSNPWIQPFASYLSLVWVFDPVLHTYYPRDKTAAEAALDQFRTSGEEGNAHVRYATISFLPNLSGNGNVLILSATGGATMTAALDFLLDETSMRQLRSMLPQNRSSIFPHFEALLKFGDGSKDLSTAKVIICRSPVFPAPHNP